jgi:apolipoprotein N-acyltransferase
MTDSAPGLLHWPRLLRMLGDGEHPAAPWLALAAGLLCVLAFAPFELPVLALLCLTLLFSLWAGTERPRRAAWLGFLFGLGLFGGGVSWVYVSLHTFGGMPAAMAVLATLAFCAYLALFPALAGSLQARLPRSTAVPWPRLLLAMPALWLLGEWLRGWLLTGFPWLGLGYAQSDSALLGYAPLLGMYGCSLLVALAAGLLAAMLHATRLQATGTPSKNYTKLLIIKGFVLACLYGGGAMLQQHEWTTALGEPLPVALVQGNVAQEMKFDPQRYAATLATYQQLIEDSLTPASAARPTSASGDNAPPANLPARLIVLPETALPRLLDAIDPAYLEALRQRLHAANADALIGVPLRDRAGQFYNASFSLGRSPTQFYAKSHLVPLGEFVPPEFAWILQVMSIPLSDFSPPRHALQPLPIAGQQVAVNICYEDAFGEEIIRQLPQATLLVNQSNVAWFGQSLAPVQHLQIARLRAAEAGRPMLRATNTGVTALIDHRGQVSAQLPGYQQAVLRGLVQGRSGSTPYVRWGNRPVLLIAALMLLAALCLPAVLSNGLMSNAVMSNAASTSRAAKQPSR